MRIAAPSLTLVALLTCGPAWSQAPGAPQTGDSRAAIDFAAPMFDGSVLHEIRIRMAPDDWRALIDHYGENTYYKADFSWRDRSVTGVAVRSRGAGSRNPHKPGLKIDFNRYTTGQEFLGLSSLVLDNLYTDVSMLRERVAMAFYATLELPVPRESSVLLFVNDEYIGLYAIVEPVDKRFMKHHGLDADGFLFEYRFQEKWLFTSYGTDLDAYATHFEPRTREKTPPMKLYEPLQKFVDTLGRPDVPMADVERFLDVRLFLRQVAADIFLADWDGLVGEFGMNNFYLLKQADTDRFTFIVWDKDNAFKSSDYPVWPDALDENLLVKRLLAEPPLRDVFWKALEQCVTVADARESPTSPTWLQRELETQYSLIVDAARLDGRKAPSNRLFEEAVDGLREFVKTRGGFVKNAMTARRTPPKPAAH